MEKVLVLIPTKPNIDIKTLQFSKELEDQLYGFTVIRDFSGGGDRDLKETLIQKATRIAQIRQKMIDKYLGEEDYVLWIDADIISYTRETIDKLISVSKEFKAITAPLVLIQGSMQFWDIAGFIHAGQWASRTEPFFKSNDTYLEMQSVGCFYLVPAKIYQIQKYIPVIKPQWTEHYNICKNNRVICYTKLSVIHINV